MPRAVAAIRDRGGNEPYSDTNAPSSLGMTLGTEPPAPPAGQTVLWTPEGKSLLMKAPDGTITTVGPSAGGGGSGTAEPGLYTRAQMQVVKNAGLSTVTAVGIVAPTLTATASNADDTTGRWLQHSTSATINNASGMISPTYVQFQRGWKVDGIFGFRQGNDILAQRNWIGFFSALPDASATPAIHLAAFRFDTVQNANFWQCVTAAGTATQTVTTTTLAATAGAIRRFRIGLNEGGLNQVTFYVDDVLVATHTTNLPTATQPLGYGMRITTLVAGAKTLRWNRVAFLDYA